MHISIATSIVLLGIEDLLIVRVAMEEAAGIMEVLGEELHVLNAPNVDGFNDLGDSIRSWP